MNGERLHTHILKGCPVKGMGEIPRLGVGKADRLVEEARNTTGEFCSNEFRNCSFEVGDFFAVGGVAYPLLSLTQCLVDFQTFDAPEVIESGEEHHGTEVGD